MEAGSSSSWVPPSETKGDGPPPYEKAYEKQKLVQPSHQLDPLALLSKYDTVILLDDSGSMTQTDSGHGVNRWFEAIDALKGLAKTASEYDEDGIDIEFLNNTQRRGRGLKDEESVDLLFVDLNPWGRTPLAKRLKVILREYMEKATGKDTILKIFVRRIMGKKKEERPEVVKPINILIITDGRPNSEQGVKDVIEKFVKKLMRRDFSMTQVGIQFVQIGDDTGAKEFLKMLDDDLGESCGIWDIVDTTPYRGMLDSNALTKILLGGINRRVDMGLRLDRGQ